MLVGGVLLVQHVIDRSAAAQTSSARRSLAAAPSSSPSAPGRLPDGFQLALPGLAPGACTALRPTAGDRGRTLFIDPGHGGPDPGTLGNGVREKDATLGVALALADLLRADGWRVVLSRLTDTTVTQVGDADLDGGALRGSALHRDLVARVDCANASRAELLLSIHFNAFPDPSAGGTETFYDSTRPFAERSRLLASDIQRALVVELGLDDRGVTADGDLQAATITDAGAAYGHLVELGPAMPGWLDRPSAMPGALVEPLFVTDPAEAALAAAPAGRARIAKALFAGLKTYLGSQAAGQPTRS